MYSTIRTPLSQVSSPRRSISFISSRSVAYWVRVMKRCNRSRSKSATSPPSSSAARRLRARLWPPSCGIHPSGAGRIVTVTDEAVRAYWTDAHDLAEAPVRRRFRPCCRNQTGLPGAGSVLSSLAATSTSRCSGNGCSTRGHKRDRWRTLFHGSGVSASRPGPPQSRRIQSALAYALRGWTPQSLVAKTFRSEPKGMCHTPLLRQLRRSTDLLPR